MDFSRILEYYQRPDITGQLIKNAKNREIAGALRQGGFGQRPNILQFPSDVAQMVHTGVVSFHYSVEHWPHPMSVGTKGYETTRTGWDMVLDMDSRLGIEESRIAALLVCDMLEKYSIKNYGIKFSGSRGFHIALPWVMFPKEVDYNPLSKRYPEVPQVIAGFVREKIRNRLMTELKKSAAVHESLKTAAVTDPFYLVDVEKNWSNRHMFRAPYSLNEKTWLASVPLTKQQLIVFETGIAKPENVRADAEFFRGEENEAQDLLRDALDWNALQKKYEPKTRRSLARTGRIPEACFPPCIKAILAGLEDGRKRSLFVLINFLRSAGWQWGEIEEKIRDWNMRNKDPLPNTTVIGQLRYQKNKDPVPPANCDVERYYKDIGICKPDVTCKTIKNPAGYALKRSGTMQEKPVYKCSACNNGFKSMKILNRHRSRSHGAVQ